MYCYIASAKQAGNSLALETDVVVVQFARTLRPKRAPRLCDNILLPEKLAGAAL
jgi:hypothetical protein